jgi:hypothetical protein
MRVETDPLPGDLILACALWHSGQTNMCMPYYMVDECMKVSMQKWVPKWGGNRVQSFLPTLSKPVCRPNGLVDMVDKWVPNGVDPL